MNVGIILPNLGMSQLAYLAINQANLGDRFGKHNYFLFFQDIELPCIKPRVACLNISELSNFDGVLISTNVDMTLMAMRAVNNVKYIFYVWDLEWIRRGGINFQEAMKVFRNPEVSLVARSDDHAKAIINYCNREPSLIAPNLNIEAILEELGKKDEVC